MSSTSMQRLAGFAVAVLFGFALWAAISASHRDTTATSQAAQRVAPTADAYHTSVKEVLQPFLEQTAALTPETVATLPPQFADLVARTQERLLRVVVPADERATHLELVLLLDQWKRAMSGSGEDRVAALEKTRAAVDARPWLR